MPKTGISMVGARKIFQPQLCVSIFHSANAMNVRGFGAGVGPEKNVRLWCSVTRQLSHRRPTVTPVRWQNDCAWHTSYMCNCLHPCLWHAEFNTYMCVICTQSNLWPGTGCVQCTTHMFEFELIFTALGIGWISLGRVRLRAFSNRYYKQKLY